MLDFELLSKTQRLIGTMVDQMGVISVDSHSVLLRHKIFLRTFPNFEQMDGVGDGGRFLYLEVEYDGAKYQAIVYETEPEYAKLKEKAPAGLDSGQKVKK